ncbi:MAG: aspartate aminotransferase [Alphaproteobacteria bacterium]|nr:MAG: aspartate aminotransferase [Alphaproteobacteria bacterium]
MKWPSKRFATASQKGFGMYEQALKLEEQNIDLIHLEFGRPFSDTPLHIKEAAKKALDDGIVHYGDFRGSLHFREALVDKLKNFNNITAGVDEVLVTNGLTHASFSAIFAAIDPGDEVILLEPYYPQHSGKIEMAGGCVVMAPLDVENNFSIRRDLIEEKITPKTRMIVLINPANPTGRIYSKAELQIIADLAIEYDLLVLSDEVYEYITYDDGRHISIATLPGMRERTITCFAFTKAYSMDGWRIGYLTADRSLIPAIMAVIMNDVTHVNVFVQEGAHAAVTGSQECLREMLAVDKRKRDTVVEALNGMKGVTCHMPESTIYAFPNITATGKQSTDLALEILHKAHVVVESGNFYGDLGEGYLRVCFGSESEERIREAMMRLTKFFNSP